MFLFHDFLAGKEEEAGRVRQAGRQGGGGTGSTEYIYNKITSYSAGYSKDMLLSHIIRF